jgi:hypothetical protein
MDEAVAAPSAAPSDTRPTMQEAFASNPPEADSLTATPDETAPPADAIAPPVPPADVTPVLEGTIPVERHKAVLDKAYDRAERAEAELHSLRQQAGWMASQEGQQLSQWAEQYRSNPREWFARTAQELAAQSPELAAQMRSDAARILASRTQPVAAEQPVSFEPDIPVYDETGRLVDNTFSAKRVQALIQHSVQEALKREVGPMKTDYETRKQAQEQERVTKEAHGTATKQFEAAKQWPGFLSDPAKGTVDPDLVKAFTEHPDWSLEGAYITVVVPKLQAREQAQTLDHLKTKAAAASVTPNGAVVASTKRPTSMLDPSLRWS